MNRFKLLSYFCVMTILGSCGGATTSQYNVPGYTSYVPPTGPNHTFSEAVYSGAALIEGMYYSNVTAVSDMPVGTATYNGYAGFGPGTSITNIEQVGLAGKIKLQVNFDNKTFNGELTDFVNYANERAQGSVNILGDIEGNTLKSRT